MDRLGYCLGDCSGAPVLASTSFGVTKVVRELPHFKRKLIWPFLASVMRPQAPARHDRIRQHTPFEIACQCGREGFRAGDSLLEGIARDTMNTCWGDLLGWRNPSGAGDFGARKSSVPRLTTFPLTCLASLRGTSSSSSPNTVNGQIATCTRKAYAPNGPGGEISIHRGLHNSSLRVTVTPLRSNGNVAELPWLGLDIPVAIVTAIDPAREKWMN
jgi:hypothetical protein